MALSLMIAVHGAGYLGLTAAMHFARAGEMVTIYDSDSAAADRINAGRPHGREAVSYLDTGPKHFVESGRLSATDDVRAVLGAPVHLVAVRSERDGEPDMAAVTAVVRRLLADAPSGAVLLIESPLTPGATDLMLAGWAGMPGKDKYVAVCPRRDWLADREKNLARLPRVVGGVTPVCTEAAVAVLEKVSPDCLRTDYRTAELTHVFENALLHVQVLVACQLAWALPDQNVAEAVALAGSHWGVVPLELGLGAGAGPAMGIARLLDADTRGRLTLVNHVAEFEHLFWRLAAAAVARRVGEGGSVVVLGIGHPDCRTGLGVARALVSRGLAVAVHDPVWSPEELGVLAGLPVREPTADDAGIVVATRHPEYEGWPKNRDRWRAGQVVLDGPGVWDRYRGRLETFGVRYVRVGEPGWTW